MLPRVVVALLCHDSASPLVPIRRIVCGVVPEPDRQATSSPRDPADEAERRRTQFTGFSALAGVWLVVAVVVAVIVAVALILYYAA